MLKFGKKIMLAMVFILCLTESVSAAQFLIPGGQVVGLQLGGDRVTVAAFDETLGQPARQSGLKVGDRILTVDDHPISSVEDVREALSRSHGTVAVRFTRDGKEKSLNIAPSITPDGPRLGIYLREGVNGIGTVTWYDPDTNIFATLGHGVSLSGGELVKMNSGQAFRASVASVRKGKAGNPGQLMGVMDPSAPLGELTDNTDQGLFGTASSPFTGKPLEVAVPAQVHTGKATVFSTVSDEQIRSYSVEIQKIYPTAGTSGRNMLIRVTDPELLALTGGIVQGMSGSPIVQDGKLVGAVTHVLVNDPTRGYGIFAENMLESAQSVANENKLKDAS